MSLTKVNYIDNSTIITAQNLNDIQDNIIQNSELVKKAAPRNLLDNSYFADPVNQRGATSYTGAVYGIDRWKGANASTQINVSPGTGIILAANGAYNMIVQRFPKGTFAGKTLTFAVCDGNGKIHVGSAVYAEDNTTSTPYNDSETGIQLVFDGRQSDVDIARIGLGNSAAADVTIRWAALYEGEYTAETLPEYQPKGYGAELMECQRYYQADVSTGYGFSTSGSMKISVPIPVRMRVAPSIENLTIGTIRVNNASITPTAITYSSMNDNRVVLNATYESGAAGGNNHAGIWTGKCSLSADL